MLQTQLFNNSSDRHTKCKERLTYVCKSLTQPITGLKQTDKPNKFFSEHGQGNNA